MIQIALLTLWAATVAKASPLSKRADAGYLATTFNGGEEQVFLQIASANNPQSFRTLNKGQPYLRATLGTQGARDPSIVKSNDGSSLYILATDLKIASTDWGTAQRFGSRSVHVWKSSDGVTWSSDRLAQLMPPTAGYVWAPSAIWDPAASSYAIFWSSVVFKDSDPNHTGPADGPYIFYSHTSDFQAFTSPQRWDTANNATAIDQEIQHLGGNSYVRYLSDTKEVRRVVLDRSDSGLFGTWNRIGVPVDQVREGPAAFRDIRNPSMYYLWEDNYNGAGYQCYRTTDFKVPYEACPQALTPEGMRHGGVVTIDSVKYSNLSTI